MLLDIRGNSEGILTAVLYADFVLQKLRVFFVHYFNVPRQETEFNCFQYVVRHTVQEQLTKVLTSNFKHFGSIKDGGALRPVKSADLSNEMLLVHTQNTTDTHAFIIRKKNSPKDLKSMLPLLTSLKYSSSIDCFSETKLKEKPPGVKFGVPPCPKSFAILPVFAKMRIRQPVRG